MDMTLYDQATAILNDCRHEQRTSEVNMGKGITRMVCCACWNAHVYARRAADKARREAEPKDCQRCARKPVRWNYGGYRLCGRCKTATEKEHYQHAAKAGVLAIFATAPMVDTREWAARKEQAQEKAEQ
jgi:hypothetical protein